MFFDLSVRSGTAEDVSEGGMWMELAVVLNMIL